MLALSSLFNGSHSVVQNPEFLLNIGKLSVVLLLKF